MSTKSIREGLSDRLLHLMSSEVNLYNRSQLIKSGQAYVLYLDDFKFIDQAIAKVQGIHPQTIIKKRYGGRQAALKIAKQSHINYLNKYKIMQDQPASLSNNYAALTLSEKDPKTFQQLGHTAFLTTYYDAANLKERIVARLLDSTVDPYLKDLVTASLHRGHGAGGGLAVSAITISRTFKAADDGLNPEGASLLRQAFKLHMKDVLKAKIIRPKELTLLTDLQMNYKQIVDSYGASAEYIAHLRFQLDKENTGIDSSLERKLKNVVTKFFEKEVVHNIIHMHGSSSLFEKLNNKILNIFRKFSSLKVTSSLPETPQMKTSGKLSDKKVIAGKHRGSITTLPGKPIPVDHIKNNNLVRLQMLIPIINERLHDTIQKNMGSPKLNYRTGRFASSARVEDIVSISGMPDVRYTYMKYPYQVFEHPPISPEGARLATPMRDPRLVIGQSIREIASEYITQHFTTTRF